MAIARLAIITPSWLKVERAMIFLRSHSTKATDPAINIVRVAERRSIGGRYGVEITEG